MIGLKTPQIEISTIADIPSGTGLGSSGSFTTAILRALYAYEHKPIHAEELAELACEIEINRLIKEKDRHINNLLILPFIPTMVNSIRSAIIFGTYGFILQS
jgi:homoserine kinase